MTENSEMSATGMLSKTVFIPLKALGVALFD